MALPQRPNKTAGFLQILGKTECSLSRHIEARQKFVILRWIADVKRHATLSSWETLCVDRQETIKII